MVENNPNAQDLKNAKIYIYSFTQWSISTENELQLYVPPEVKFRNNILLLKPKSQTLTKLRHHFMA